MTPIIVAKLRKTSNACPAQWEGETQDGEYIYIRYRWGELSIKVNSETVLEENIGDALDGVMDEAELMRHTHPFILYPWTPDAIR
jgi:hypothetical protein